MSWVDFFLGMTVGLLIAVTIYGIFCSGKTENQETQDDWWKRGEPPPWEIYDEHDG